MVRSFGSVPIFQLLAGLVLACLAGCNGPGQPTLRMGALPFPGLGLYNVVDPEDLGKHRYWSAFQFVDGEVGRGIIYTQHAGFVDIAHVRDTADWTRYYAVRAREALESGDPNLTAGGPDRSRIHMRFNYPPGWRGLPREQRDPLINELALRAGQEAAYAVSTFHELLTWYDYGVLPLISERHSAFTYDDVMGHVIGLYVAERAWSDPRRRYGQSMTVAIRDVLRELGAARPHETRQAVAATRDWWWIHGRALKRHLDVGLVTGTVQPMLIDDFVVSGSEPLYASQANSSGGPTGDHSPVPTISFVVPRVSQVQGPPGIDLAGFFTLELEPRVGLYRRTLRQRLPGRPARIVPQRDLPVLMDHVRGEMRREFGPLVDSVADGPALATGGGPIPAGDGAIPAAARLGPGEPE